MIAGGTIPTYSVTFTTTICCTLPSTHNTTCIPSTSHDSQQSGEESCHLSCHMHIADSDLFPARSVEGICLAPRPEHFQIIEQASTTHRHACCATLLPFETCRPSHNPSDEHDSCSSYGTIFFYFTYGLAQVRGEQICAHTTARVNPRNLGKKKHHQQDRFGGHHTTKHALRGSHQNTSMATGATSALGYLTCKVANTPGE